MTVVSASKCNSFEVAPAEIASQKKRGVHFIKNDIAEIICGKTHKKARYLIEESSSEIAFKHNHGTTTRSLYKESQEDIAKRVSAHNSSLLEKAHADAGRIAREVVEEGKEEQTVTPSSSSSSAVLKRKVADKAANVQVAKKKHCTRSKK